MEIHEIKQVVLSKICPTCGQVFRLDAVESACPNDGSLLAPVLEDQFVGQMFNESLQIEELIGSGGAGKVYRARQMPIGRVVAVKILQNKQISDMDKIRRFEREARALSRLTHPNIISIFDYGLLPYPYMVMEFIEGQGLDAFCGKEQLPIEEVLRIAFQICDALQMAHENGVVHRDLKPSNVMVCRRDDDAPVAKVLDFGLARWTPTDDSNAPTVTITGDVVGTPAYMSPEQCLGKTPDNRSDIYAMGCILYELITGARPFSAATIVEYMNKHTKEPPRTFFDVNPELALPDFLEEVVMRCLEKDPRRRFQSVATLKAALERSLLLVKTKKVKRRKRGRRKIHRARIVAMLLLSAFITAGIFLNQCYPQVIPDLVFQNTFNSAKAAFAQANYAKAEEQFKSAAELALQFGDNDRQRRRFTCLEQLLQVYMAESKLQEAVALNDQLIAMSGIEEKLRRYNGNGISFFWPSKWFMDRTITDWNEASKFKVVHTLRWSQLSLQVYTDKVSTEELANLEQQLYSKICKGYRLVDSKEEMIGRDKNIRALVKDFEVAGDFGMSQGSREFHFIDTGKVAVHRHVYFGTPGRIYKIRIQGDSMDYPHLTRALSRILDTVILSPEQPIKTKNPIEISRAQFYLSSDTKKENALCVVEPGQKPDEGFEKVLDLKR